ncbi:hypothetical protein Vi05172_g259 [Venturia inaequalis]|nr:hypothetical protein Vi05172_g259 [Venturia inaequalis]
MAKRKRNNTESSVSSNNSPMDSSPTPSRTTLGPQALKSDVTSMLNSIKELRKDIKRISNQGDKADKTSGENHKLAARVVDLEARVERMDGTVCDAMMRVEGAMTVMANKLQAVNFNTIARAENARFRIDNKNAQLSPLHNIETNQEIAYFPATTKALSKMGHNLLQALLQELGAPMPGRSRRTMRNRASLVIGLNCSTDVVDVSLGGEESKEIGFNGTGEFQGAWDGDFGMGDFGANRFDSDQFHL